jgi:hypothetical protein
MSEKAGISNSFCHAIANEGLGMSCVVAKVHPMRADGQIEGESLVCSH